MNLSTNIIGKKGIVIFVKVQQILFAKIVVITIKRLGSVQIIGKNMQERNTNTK